MTSWIAQFLMKNASLILGYVSGVATSYIATVLYERNQLRKGNKDLRQVLSFDSAEVLLILPHREKEPNSIMPRIAIEDFLALNNVVRSIAGLGRKKTIKIRDVEHVTAKDRTDCDIVSIGSPKVNPITDEILSSLSRDHAFRFEKDPFSGRLHLKRGDATYVSRSYDKDGNPPEDERVDLAIVVRVPNPWNTTKKALVVAGIRGIGTWAAAELIRKRPKDLTRKPESGGTGNFTALIKVQYMNYDILNSEVDQLFRL